MSLRTLLCMAVMLCCLISCTKSSPLTYKKVSCPNSEYALEIPPGYAEYRCIEDFISYVGDEQHTHFSIQKMPSDESLSEYVDRMKNESFTYSLMSETPNSIKLQVTRGTNMWAAYEFYGIKEVNGTSYLIEIESDKLNNERMEEIFNHMLTSLQ